MFLPQGFEDLEAITIIDVFGWTHIRSHLTSIHLKTCAFHSHVVGKFGTTIKVDYTITENILDYRSFDTYRAFVLPGGFHDAGFDEAYSAAIHQIATRIYGNNGVIATMCVGISPIADAGLLHGKKATTYSLNREHDNVARLEAGGASYTGQQIEEDDSIISSSGPASALEVALLVVEKLTGKANTDEIKTLMTYSPCRDAVEA